MKKYFSFLLAFSMVFVLGMSILSFAKTVEAATTTCKFGDAYDIEGTSCAIIAVCTNTSVYAYNHKTGALCPGVTVANDDARYKTFSEFLADTVEPVSYGDQGWDIAILQAFLAEQGFLPKNFITGKSLGNTKAALKKFQKSEGITADGIAGRQTIGKFKDVLKRNPTIAKNIAKTSGSAPVKNLTPKKKSGDTTTGGSGSTGTSGGSNGSGGIGLSDPAVCEPPHEGTKSQAYEAVITTDNYLMIYKWNKVTQKLTFLHKDLPNFSTYVLDQWMGWQTAQKFSFTLEKDEELVWVAVNDAMIDDGIAGHFLIKQVSGPDKVSVTKPGIFERMRTKMLKPVNPAGLATSDNIDIIREIKNGTWEPVNDEIGPMGMSPWGAIPGISKQAKWLPTWGVREADNHITIFKTQFSGDGALPPCTCPPGFTGTLPDCIPPVIPTCPPGTTGTYPNCTPQTCPEGTTGTYPNCNPILTCPPGSTGTYPNCTTNGTCPDGWTGTPPQCVPPPSVLSLTGECRGVAWPALEVVVKVKFNQPVLVTGTPIIKVLGAPNDHGVEMAYQSSSADKMTLTFRYVAPGAGLPDPNNYQQEDYIGNGKVGFKLPLASGSSIKRQSDGINVSLTGSWAIPNDTLKCVGGSTSPTPAMCVSWADVAVYGDDVLEYKVTYTDSVVIDNKGNNSNIELIIDPSNPSYPNITAILDGADAHTLHFASGSGPGFTFDFAAHVGQATLNFKNGATLKVGGVTVGTNLGSFNTECIQILSGSADYRPTLLPGEEAGSRRANYSITFNRPVTITGAPTLKVKNANGAENVEGVYLSGLGTATLTFHVNYLASNTFPSWPTDYEGTAVLYLNGGTIKDMNDHSMNLTVPPSVIFDYTN